MAARLAATSVHKKCTEMGGRRHGGGRRLGFQRAFEAADQGTRVEGLAQE